MKSSTRLAKRASPRNARATRSRSWNRRRSPGRRSVPTARPQAEQSLAEAKARVEEPWSERRDAAVAHRRAVDAEYATFVSDHLDELVTQEEADGQTAADRINELAAATVATFSELRACADRIAALAVVCGPVRPGDVSFSRAEQFVHAASDLLIAGGEQGPKLRHDPRRPHHESRLGSSL